MLDQSFASLQDASRLLPWFLPLTGLVLGLIVGSFLNVVILRLPARLEWEWSQGCSDHDEGVDSPAPPGLVRPRSSCPACGHQITALENIPVISYLFLRGRCSSCQTTISPRYPLVESATGVLTALLFLQFGLETQTLLWAIFLWTLIALVMIDFDHHLLPDNLTLPLMWLGLLASIWNVFVPPTEAIMGAAVGYLVLWSVYQIHHQLTGKEGMGHGDFKLLAAVGAWGGIEVLPATILMASAFGSIIGLALQYSGRLGKDMPMAFGPYLGICGFINLLYGEQIVGAYLNWVT